MTDKPEAVLKDCDGCGFTLNKDGGCYYPYCSDPQQPATPAQPDAAALVEALRTILNVRVDRDDNIWAGAERCRAVARAALQAWEQSNG